MPLSHELLIRLRSNRVFYLPPGPADRVNGVPIPNTDESSSWGMLAPTASLRPFTFDADDGKRVEITVFKNLYAQSQPDLHGCVIRVRA